MAEITGIGGIFVRSRDPSALAAWYRDVLGMPLQGWGGCQFGTGRGNDDLPESTLWKPLAASNPYFAPSERDIILNLTVDDLDDMIEQLQAKGVALIGRDDNDPSGRYAWIKDPEGAIVELWEVKQKFWGTALARPERI